MDELRSAWSPPRRARTARGIRPTTPSSCVTLENVEDPFVRATLSGCSPVSPYAASAWRQRPPSSMAAYGRDREREGASRSPSARSRRPEVRAPFIVPSPNAIAMEKNLRNKTPSLPFASVSTSSAPHPVHQRSHSHRSSGGSAAPHGQPVHTGSFTAGMGPRRTPASIIAPIAPTLSAPASPANSPQGMHDPGASSPGPSPLSGPGPGTPSTPSAASEPDQYAAQMLALTEHLQRVQDARVRKNVSPSKAPPGNWAVLQRRMSHTTWMFGEGGGGRVSANGGLQPSAPSPGLRDRDSVLPVAAMQQRLQHKFGEEAAAFMLHDLKEVPEHLHVLFYTVILQLRELPSPLPSTLGEAYHAVFTQHFDRTVSAAERRHVAFRTQMAQLQVQTAVQLEALQQRVSELSPRGARPTAHAQLQQLQKQVQVQTTEHQAQLKMYAAQAIAAQELHIQVMKLLCVAAAAQERLSREQLAAMGLDGVLEHLPAWEVLFHAREGVLMMADPSLEAWLTDKKAAKQFAADPRVGHAVLGQHYRQVAERDVRALDLYGLRYAVLHLLLSDEEVTGGERLLMDPEYMEQVFRLQEEGTLYLTLLRLTHKTEVVSESLRWMRNNMGALRAYPRAVPTLWQTAPSRTLFARLAAAAEGRTLPAMKRLHRGSANMTEEGGFGGGDGSASAATATAVASIFLRPSSDGGAAAAAAAAAAADVSASVAAASSLGNCNGGSCAAAHAADDLLASPPVAGSSAAATAAAAASGGGDTTRRSSRPQCRLLNPPPFWPAAVTQLPGHAGGVTSLVFDRRNRLLAAATAAGNVLVWDHATARRVGTLAGYSPLVPCVDMHPSGKLLAVGSSTDCAVRVRALDSGSGPLLVFHEPQPDPVVKSLAGPKNTTVRHLSYSPDGHLLAVVYGDGAVTVWDPVKGVRSSTMPVINKATAARYASFSPNGQLLALACANGTIRVWHLERLNPLHISVLRAYDSHVPIRAVLYSPSGLLLASLAEGASEVVLWDVSTGHQLQVLAGPPGAAPVRALAFNPGGLLLATAGEDGDVAIWNANTRGQWMHAASLRGHSFAVNALAFSPCGLVLATGGNEDGVRLWDMGAVLNRSEAQRADLGYALPGPGGGGYSSNPAGAPAGGNAAAGGGSGGSNGAQAQGTAASHCITVRGDEAGSSGRHPTPGAISCLVHNPNGTQLAAGMADGAVCVWDAAAPRRSIRLVARHRRPVGRVVYSANGNLLASASDDGCICVWNTSAIDVADTHLLTVIFVDLAFIPSANGVASGASPTGANGMTHGSFDEAALTAAGLGHAHGMSLGFRDLHGLGPGTTAWAAPAAAPTGAAAASAAGSTGGAVAAGSGSRRIGPGAGGWVTLSCSVAFSHNGAYLASAHDDGTVILWSLPSGGVAARLQGHSMLAYGLQYSPDGRLLASASDDGLVCVWDPAEALKATAEDRKPEPVARLQHSDYIYAVDFSPCGSSVATISRDGLLRAWDPRTGTCTARTPHGHATDSKDCVEGVRYSPTGHLLATWSTQDATVRLWHAGSCVLLRELTGLRLMTWAGLGPGPWAAVLCLDYAPFVVRLPERALLLEAAAIEAGAAADSPEVATAAADEVAEGLAGAAIGLPPLPHTGPTAQRRQAQLQRCREVTFRPRPDPLVPVVADRASPLRPCVRIFSGTRSVQHVSLRGRSLILADSSSTAFYAVTHEAPAAAEGTAAAATAAAAAAAGAAGGGAGVDLHRLQHLTQQQQHLHNHHHHNHHHQGRQLAAA